MKDLLQGKTLNNSYNVLLHIMQHNESNMWKILLKAFYVQNDNDIIVICEEESNMTILNE